MVLKKEKIFYALLILTLLATIFRFFMVPLWGNPFTKISYWVQAHQYISERYGFGVRLGLVDYGWKESTYSVSARAHKYNDFRFRIYFERRVNGVIITDNLCRVKWSNDIKTKLVPIVTGLYGEYDVLSVSMDGSCSYDFTEGIPNYFDVMEYVAGNIYISVNLDRNYIDSELRNVYDLYKSAENLKPTSFSVHYNDRTFRVSSRDARIRRVSDLLNYMR